MCSRSWLDQRLEHARRELQLHELVGELLARSFSVFGSLAPSLRRCDSDDLRVAPSRATRSGARPPPDPGRSRRPLRPRRFLVGFLGLVPPAASSASSSLVGFCGCAITSGAFGSMKPTMTSTRRPWPALTGSYALSIVLERRRVRRPARGARYRGLPRCAWRCDLAFARQQLDRAHLAHVHAHRVGGAAELGIERGRARRRLLRSASSSAGCEFSAAAAARSPVPSRTPECPCR